VHEKLTDLHMDNISLEMSVYWLSKNIVSFKIEVGVCETFAKNVSHYTQIVPSSNASSNLLREANSSPC